ncbi:hypothetical protein GALL_205920 [mine drainage metagenome]|uniref:Uncharacterized protein n=1 Tax=mine drainage metagenome TaxID=410659 RepID=A0A1J5RMS3_9ZZZZ
MFNRFYSGSNVHRKNDCYDLQKYGEKTEKKGCFTRMTVKKTNLYLCYKLKKFYSLGGELIVLLNYLSRTIFI